MRVLKSSYQPASDSRPGGHDQESLLLQILESLSEGIFLTDSQGQVTLWTRQISRMTGLTAEHAVGHPLWEVLGSFYEGSPQGTDKLDRLKANILEMLVTGSSPALSNSWDVQVQTADDAPRHLRLQLAALEQDGRYRIGGTVHDLTERQEAERQQRLQIRALESAAHGIAITNPMGEILWVNPAFTRLTGYEMEEALGQTFRILKSGVQTREHYQKLWSTILSGHIWRGELVNRRKDGSLYTEEQTITPVLDERGQISHFITIMQDLTGQKAAERDAAEQRLLAEALRDTTISLVRSLQTEEVLDHILENITHIVRHDAANILLLEPDGSTRIVRSRGYSEHGWPDGLSSLHLPASELATPRMVLETGQPVLITDTKEAPNWQPHPGLEWIRSHITAPIRKGEEVIGFLNLDSAEPGFFSQAEASHLQDFADQAAVVLENARLFAETSRRAKKLEILFGLSSALRQANNSREIGEIVLECLCESLSVSGSQLVVFDPQSGERTLFIACGVWQEGGGPQQGLEPGQEAVPVLIQHASQDTRFSALAAGLNGVEALAGLPLHADQLLIGELWLGQADTISERDLHLLTAIADLTASALHRAMLFEQTQQHLRRLVALRSIDIAITGSRDLDLTLEVLFNQVVEQLGADAAAVLLLQPDSQTLVYHAGRGFQTQAFQQLEVRLNEGLAGKSAANQQTILIPDLREAGSRFVRSQAARSEGFIAYHAAPLLIKNQVKGVLEVYHRFPFQANREWIDFLEALAGQAAIAIDNTTLYYDLRRTNRLLSQAYSATLQGWSKALELRDRETQGHTERVTSLTMLVANQMNFEPDELTHVYHGALLHDIGKMAIPDSILLKPGPLSEAEWRIMRQHPLYAYELLSEITFLQSALAIPRFHHERWDGQGYPYGLVGERIPLPARLFAVVDVWDALLSDRPYRAAWSRERVEEYLHKESGTHFDPEVIEVFFASQASTQRLS